MTRGEYLKRKIFLKQQAISLIQDEIKLLRTELSQFESKEELQPDPQKPPAIEIPILGGETFPVYPEDINEWAKAFPAVDIQITLQKIRQWAISNPKKQKTRRGARKFITSWLSREQDRPHPNIPNGQPVDQRPKVWIPKAW